MRVGIFCAGVGPFARPAYLKASALAAERTGFSTFWLGEHVLLFKTTPESKYPYPPRDDSEFAVSEMDPAMAIADPVVTHAWIAAWTKTIEIGTAIIILPQRNPAVFAKELATLDVLSEGRLVLGAGVGWCKEESDAIGLAWERRGRRMDDNIDALRALWREGASSFESETIRFRDAYSYPKPVRKSGIPILIGGESEPALRRIARHGDGWLSSRLSVEEAPAKVEHLKALTRQEGRDPDSLRLILAIPPTTTEDELKRYRDAGITEFYLLIPAMLPPDEDGLVKGIEELSRRFVEPAARI